MQYGRHSLGMAERYQAEDRGNDTELEFYLPAMVTPSVLSTWVTRLRASLRKQSGESSK